MTKTSKKQQNIQKIGDFILNNEDDLKGKIITMKHIAKESGVGNASSVSQIFREYEPLAKLNINVLETTGGKPTIVLEDKKSVSELNKRINQLLLEIKNFRLSEFKK